MAGHDDGLRIGDAERQAALDRLAEEYAVGRLTRDEVDERGDAVWSARTRGDLAPIFADLPAARRDVPVGSRRPPRSRRLLPILAVVAVIVGLTHLPVLLLLGAVFLVVTGRIPHTSGRRRWARGRCW